MRVVVVPANAEGVAVTRPAQPADVCPQVLHEGGINGGLAVFRAERDVHINF